MTFLVTQDQHQEGVRRRFRDFEWLRAVLHARYIGLLVPSLPDKTITVLKGDAFVQSRMRGLQRFLNGIMETPYLRSDAAVASFLGEPGDGSAWETARMGTAVMDNAGVGHMRWLQRILCEHIADSPESEISTFKRHVEQRERLLTELLSCAKRLSDKTETGTGSPKVHNDAPLVAILNKCAATINGWGLVERFQPAIYELILLENVKYLLHQATDMKQLLLELGCGVARIPQNLSSRRSAQGTKELLDSALTSYSSPPPSADAF
ncbi:hypothetical protein BBJ29_004957 [Phytophthora kernoviae]|uniref:PX domain-containing protein n=1 Tax=Phytophthora kernoviae TaxID=325452 RepID=A0A3F2RYF8_9STRA|nr:hypothetical protein BBJ29_004957 [Phytophthora kernoviae]RLN66194.1 hypothetical protein BBP00_00002391 [Phytophthora kernoviae]